MPRIVRVGGLHLTDEVVKIHDLGPAGIFKKGPPPRPSPAEAGEETDGLGGWEAQLPEQDLAPANYGMESSALGSAVAVREEIVQGAMAEASRILEEAIVKAEQAKAEYLLQAKAEVEELRLAAAQEGRREGFLQVTEEVRQTAEGLEAAVASFEGERAGFEAEFEEQMKWLAIEIASKVLAKKVADDDSEMLEMVQKAVQSVRAEPWIRVEVASEMTRLIDGLTALWDGQPQVEVSAVPAEPGTVHIETPTGVVDASLRTQLENLREYFVSASR